MPTLEGHTQYNLTEMTFRERRVCTTLLEHLRPWSKHSFHLMGTGQV